MPSGMLPLTTGPLFKKKGSSCQDEDPVWYKYGRREIDSTEEKTDDVRRFRTTVKKYSLHSEAKLKMAETQVCKGRLCQHRGGSGANNYINAGASNC